jgi:hypothetical protein
MKIFTYAIGSTPRAAFGRNRENRAKAWHVTGLGLAWASRGGSEYAFWRMTLRAGGGRGGVWLKMFLSQCVVGRLRPRGADLLIFKSI